MAMQAWLALISTPILLAVSWLTEHDQLDAVREAPPIVWGALLFSSLGASLFAAGQEWAERFPAVHRTLVNKYWVDEIYDATVVKGTWASARGLFRFDASVIDGFFVNGTRNLTVALATDFNTFLDGLSIGNTRLVDFNVEVKVSQQSILDDFQMQFAHAADQSLTRLATLHLNRGILTAEHLERVFQLLSLG